MAELKVLSLFSGIGAFEKALENLCINYKLINFCEVDKYAVKSYCAIHNVDESKNLGDITHVDISKLSTDVDLITHGSPCQDFSVAGNNRGGDEGANTRSSLMWNAVEIIKHCKPKYVIWENVKNVLSKKHRHNFDKYLRVLYENEYESYYKVMNAKDYGVPQNRERVFVVSIRKDINKGFIFPNGWKLDKRLKDVLEVNVDDKFYIADEKVQQLIKNCNGKIDLNKHVVGTCHKDNNLSFATRDRVVSERLFAPTLSATMYKDAPKVLIENDGEPKINQIGLLDMRGQEQARRVYSANGISPTINTMQGGNLQPKVLIEGNINPSGKGMNGNVFNITGVSPTLTTNKGEGNKILISQATKKGYIEKVERTPLKFLDRNGKLTGEDYAFCVDTSNTGGLKETYNTGIYRIRKLTPLECWRLMGFTDDDYNKAKSIPTSNSQLYKQAGNSIVVDVLEEIFKKLLKEE